MRVAGKGLKRTGNLSMEIFEKIVGMRLERERRNEKKVGGRRGAGNE